MKFLSQILQECKRKENYKFCDGKFNDVLKLPDDLFWSNVLLTMFSQQVNRFLIDGIELEITLFGGYCYQAYLWEHKFSQWVQKKDSGSSYVFFDFEVEGSYSWEGKSKKIISLYSPSN